MILLLGLGYGDEGKGSLIDALSRRAVARGQRVVVIRYNGGPQAAHHVVTDSGQSHCFAQLGAGMFLPEVSTHLSQHMLIDPPALLREAEALCSHGISAPLRRLTIDARCVIVTPFHKLLNRMQESARGNARHGSCGLGVGQAWLDSQNASLPSLRFGQVRDEAVLAKSLRFLQLVKVDQGEQLAAAHPNVSALRTYLAGLQRADLVPQLVEAYKDLSQQIARIDDGQELRKILHDETCTPLFEGAQGALLDAERGFWPYVTPSRTTYENARRLLAECETERPYSRLGVLRAYATRHGVGPFVTHDAQLEAALPESHNRDNPWQGEMRVGWFDAVAARYAIETVGGCDAIALTNLDRLNGCASVRVCVAYRLTDADGKQHILYRLPFSASANREHQSALTEQLAHCQPIYEELPGWERASDGKKLSEAAESYVRFLESEARLGIPISIVSSSATASGKLFRS